MSGQLDILALEPFYGGIRRTMLDTLIRCSRHRWTLLKLPPRRIERRLTAAAHWFAEQLSRHWVGHTDLLFTSEALNLSDLTRLIPQLLETPSVVYFHSNQLPLPDAKSQSPLDLINLNSASAASEIWFNSQFHLNQFLSRAGSLVRRYPELASRSPMSDLKAKAKVYVPPVDTTAVHDLTVEGKKSRSKRTVFVDTTDSDVDLLNAAFATLLRRGELFHILTLGPAAGLSTDLPITEIDVWNDDAQAQAMAEAGVYVSARPDAFCDHQAVRALTAGCWPLVPSAGCYGELLPSSIHSSCMYGHDPDVLASRLQDVFHLEQIGGFEAQMRVMLRSFNPAVACKLIDERLLELASGSPAASAR